MEKIVNQILGFFNSLFGSPYVTELLIAMLPIVELRGAIPIGVQSGIPLPLAALIGFVGSSLVSPIILAFFIPVLNLLKKTKLFRRFAHFLETKFSRRARMIDASADKSTIQDTTQDTTQAVAQDTTQDTTQDTDTTQAVAQDTDTIQEPSQEDIKAAKKKARIKFWGVFGFVAIPLPFTGVWTGSAVAAILNLGFVKGLLAVVSGNLVAAAIITLITWLFEDYLSLVILILFAVVATIILVYITIEVVKYTKRKKTLKD